MRQQTMTPQLRINIPAVALVVLAYVALYFPVYQYTSTHIWSQVGQGHGPVMVLLVLWLAYKSLEKIKPPSDEPNKAYLGLIAIGGLFFLAGQLLEVLILSSGSQMLVIAGILGYLGGAQWLKAMAIPLAFILFTLPLPGPLVDTLTGPLKAGVSIIAEWILHHLGYPVARTGVTITIANYQMLVADACAGLNSLFALEAVGVFYMTLMGYKNKTRNILLAAMILPISIFSNVIRVITLILVTYYFGDEVGQGFVHDFAGILLLACATIATIAVDALIGPFFQKEQTKPTTH